MNKPDFEPKVDAWRSLYEAMAIVNGHDPQRAVENHRRWCIKMGYEKETPDER